jgi:hypothetical protein
VESRSRNYQVSDNTDKSIQIALRDVNERLTLIEAKLTELEQRIETHTH